MASTDSTASAAASGNAEAASIRLAAMESAAGLTDPYPFIDQLLTGGEWHVEDDGHLFVYGYQRCQEMLRSRELLKGGAHVSSVPLHLSESERQALRDAAPPDPGMLSSIDDPDHARLRRLVSISFTPKAVEQYREVTQRAIDDVLARIDPHEPVDLVPTVCLGVPIQVIGELIGLPLPDRDSFAAISARASAGRDPGNDFETLLDAVQARSEQFAYIADMIERERGVLSDTPLGRLIALQEEGERLSQPELVSLVALMYSGGFGTTVRTLGNGIVLLLDHPDQAEALRADPSLARRATDEVLRYDPTVMTVGYLAGSGAQIDGRGIELGAHCTVMIGAANRDPRVFEASNVFDVTRQRTAPPLSFGYGTHYCLGVALSKLEVDVTLGTLMRRFPRMELVDRPIREQSFRNRSWEAVNAVLEPK